MDFEFSQEQDLLRATIRRMLSERAPLESVRAHYGDRSATPDPALVMPTWTGLREIGGGRHYGSIRRDVPRRRTCRGRHCREGTAKTERCQNSGSFPALSSRPNQWRLLYAPAIHGPFDDEARGASTACSSTG